MKEHWDPWSEDAAIERMLQDEARQKQIEADLSSWQRASLDELEDEYLEAIVRLAKTGGNELAQQEAREAQAILDKRHPIDEIREGSRVFRFD